MAFCFVMFNVINNFLNLSYIYSVFHRLLTLPVLIFFIVGQKNHPKCFWSPLQQLCLQTIK